MNTHSQSISRGQWMVLLAALLGWLFDGAEMGVFSVVGRAATRDLLHHSSVDQLPPSENDLNLWFGIIIASFLVGASTGGVLFGWLGDRIGRVRAMTLSILTYALFTGLCGFAQTPLQLGVLRFIASLGMGGEWSLGVALVMEVWPNRSRAFMAGLIGAAANVGYLLVGFVGLWLNALLGEVATTLASLGLGQETIEWLVRNQGWRIIMILGTAPALLTFLIRIFVPESERWLREKNEGSTSHWQTSDLFAVGIGVLGPALIIYLWGFPQTGSIVHTWPLRLVGSIVGLGLATWGYTFPVIRYLQRFALAAGEHIEPWQPTLRRMLLAAGLSGVALLGTWGSAQWAPSWADKLTNDGGTAKYYTQIWAAAGAIVGTIAAALLGDWLGRRVTYSLLCVLSIGSLLALYRGNTEYGNLFLFCSFLVGVCTAAFYGWLPLYLPELFRTRIRATGQGFAFNFGRILAAIGALQTANLFASNIKIANFHFEGGYRFACSAMSVIYLLGLVLIWFAPETKGKTLPE